MAKLPSIPITQICEMGTVAIKTALKQQTVWLTHQFIDGDRILAQRCFHVEVILVLAC